MLDNKNKDITAKHQDERIASSRYCIYSCHFAESMYIYFTKAGKRKIGWGGGCVGVTSHAHTYVLILPAKRVFPFFGVKSIGDDSSLRRKIDVKYLFYKGKGKKDRVGGAGVTGHAHRYVLILPAK